ncbi:hypothetical protein BH09PSE2_BH09PSE2_04490 [soil metagenome]
MTASLFAFASRRLQPVALALLVLALGQLAAAGAHSAPTTSVRGVLASGLQIAPERS